MNLDILKIASDTNNNKSIIPTERKSTEGIALSMRRNGITVDSDTLFALLRSNAENLLLP